jgi:hypothetical protein
MKTSRKDGSVDSAATVQDLSEFVGVMGELKAIIEVENYFLSNGMPATLLGSAASKGALSEKYSRLGAAVTEGARGRSLSDPELQQKLFKASAELCALGVENRKLLSKALAATRRRVDAVLEAALASAPADEDQGDAGASPKKRP